MTYEEAKKDLEQMKQSYLDMDINCGLVQSLNLSIEALNKQIPTTPLDILYQKKFDIEVGICSFCGNIVNSEYEWCDGCGQHLDWSKDNDR